MNSLRIIDACTEEHFAAMSRIHARGWHAAYPGHVPDDYLRDVITEDHWIPFFREAAMSRIHARGWHAAYPGHVPDDYLRDVITEDHWIPFFREDYATGRCRGLLLYDGENPVCCCTCGPVRLGPSPRQSEGLVIHGEAYRGWGEIISFYTDPACTGRGYGSVLMEEALRRLRADGYLNCYVFVLRENEGARRFYARHGFAWDGTEEHIPFPHDMTCVDLRYTKQL